MPTHQSISLSTWQHQALIEMGIDTWYLTPLKRSETAEQRESQAIVEALVESLKAPQSTPTPRATSITASTPVPSHTISSQKSQHVKPQPRPIRLDAGLNLEPPPSDCEIVLPSPTVSDWEQLQVKSEQLAQEVGQACYHGIGCRQANTFCLFEPPKPTRKHQATQPPLAQLGFSEAEQRLQSELFTSINMDMSQMYSTRILKHATPFGQDPDANWQEKHLALLATEFALVLPKRVFLFGALPCRIMMKTNAPLSVLMPENYKLVFSGIDKKSHTASLVCLPTLGYLLAVPSEKRKIWQRIKVLR